MKKQWGVPQVNELSIRKTEAGSSGGKKYGSGDKEFPGIQDVLTPFEPCCCS